MDYLDKIYELRENYLNKFIVKRDTFDTGELIEIYHIKDFNIDDYHWPCLYIKGTYIKILHNLNVSEIIKKENYRIDTNFCRLDPNESNEKQLERQLYRLNRDFLIYTEQEINEIINTFVNDFII